MSHASKEDLERRHKLIEAYSEARIKFATQPWVRELLTKRYEDNLAGVPMCGRTHKVTQTQYDEAKEGLDQPPNNVRLYGYDLIPGDN